MNKGIIAIVILLIASVGAWYWNSSAGVFSVDSRDSIESWNFQGSHKDNGALEQRVQDDITKLRTGLEDEVQDPTDYILFVSLANQYSLLGDGKTAYANLQKALAIDSEKTGLAWHNMGSLLERLRAYNSARTAYLRAVDAQPHIDMYHLAYVDFLIRHFPEDVAAIEDAFARAEEQFNAPAPTLPLKVEWLKGQGRTEEAEAVKKQMEGGPVGEPQSIITE